MAHIKISYILFIVFLALSSLNADFKITNFADKLAEKVEIFDQKKDATGKDIPVAVFGDGAQAGSALKKGDTGTFVADGITGFSVSLKDGVKDNITTSKEIKDNNGEFAPRITDQKIQFVIDQTGKVNNIKNMRHFGLINPYNYKIKVYKSENEFTDVPGVALDSKNKFLQIVHLPEIIKFEVCDKDGKNCVVTNAQELVNNKTINELPKVLEKYRGHFIAKSNKKIGITIVGFENCLERKGCDSVWYRGSPWGSEECFVDKDGNVSLCKE